MKFIIFTLLMVVLTINAQKIAFQANDKESININDDSIITIEDMIISTTMVSIDDILKLYENPMLVEKMILLKSGDSIKNNNVLLKTNYDYMIYLDSLIYSNKISESEIILIHHKMKEIEIITYTIKTLFNIFLESNDVKLNNMLIDQIYKNVSTITKLMSDLDFNVEIYKK